MREADLSPGLRASKRSRDGPVRRRSRLVWRKNADTTHPATIVSMNDEADYGAVPLGTTATPTDVALWRRVLRSPMFPLDQLPTSRSERTYGLAAVPGARSAAHTTAATKRGVRDVGKAAPGFS